MMKSLRSLTTLPNKPTILLMTLITVQNKIMASTLWNKSNNFQVSKVRQAVMLHRFKSKIEAGNSNRSLTIH